MNFNAIGQTIVPAQNPDIILSPAPGAWDIENTGCDIRENGNSINETYKFIKN